MKIDALAYIEIRVTGRKGSQMLTPENFDISEIRNVIDNFESILFPGDKRKRPLVSYELAEGSVINRFKTTAQFALGLSALLAPIRQNPSLDFLEFNTARGIQNFQRIAEEKDYTFEISTSVAPQVKLSISKETRYHLAEDMMVDADFYFYGKLTTMGGKDRSSIRLDTDDFGLLTIHTPKSVLEQLDKNPLYKIIGIRAHGKENVKNFEIDGESLQFIEFLEYRPKYDDSYLTALIAKASMTWADVKDPNAWLRELRGGTIAD